MPKPPDHQSKYPGYLKVLAALGTATAMLGAGYMFGKDIGGNSSTTQIADLKKSNADLESTNSELKKITADLEKEKMNSKAQQIQLNGVISDLKQKLKDPQKAGQPRSPSEKEFKSLKNENIKLKEQVTNLEKEKSKLEERLTEKTRNLALFGASSSSPRIVQEKLHLVNTSRWLKGTNCGLPDKPVFIFDDSTARVSMKKISYSTDTVEVLIEYNKKGSWKIVFDRIVPKLQNRAISTEAKNFNIKITAIQSCRVFYEITEILS